MIIFYIDFSLILIISLLHLLFFFLFKESDITYLNYINSIYESSPLFEFSIEKNCSNKSQISFHVWEGIQKKSSSSHHATTLFVNETNIDKINGYYFCYKNISYKTLLYNGQIIKEDIKCQGEYNKDCGTIDTLNQHLCIKNDENCPLYDIGIGDKKDSNIYNYIENASIYYNNENYNESDKTIIGKLIFNDGQPCYNFNKKLWKKFDQTEAGEGDLKCDLEIFGKLTDDRYKYRGNISYKQIYENNLSPTFQDLLFDKINDNETVSLYKRELLGIDKTCDQKSNIILSDYEKLVEYQKNEKNSLLSEAIIISCLYVIIPSLLYHDKECKKLIPNFLLGFSFLTIFTFFICHSVFLGKIISNNLLYECSDDITNEVLRIANDNTRKSILYTALNLGLDIFIILINVILLLVVYLKIICAELKYLLSNKKKNPDINEKPIREVCVDNRTTTKKEQIPNSKDNKVQNNTNDLDIATEVDQGTNSES